MKGFQTTWRPQRQRDDVDARMRRVDIAAARAAAAQIKQGFGDALGARGGGSPISRYAYRTGETFED